MTLPQTDLSLPGVLPLVLRRTHLSSYRYGQWFGRSWASTLDERIELAPLGAGAVWSREDGSLLVYPRLPLPDDTDGVLPLEGARLPLLYGGQDNAETTYQVTDPHSGLTRSFTGSPYNESPAYWLAEIEDRNHNRITFTRRGRRQPHGRHSRRWPPGPPGRRGCTNTGTALRTPATVRSVMRLRLRPARRPRRRHQLLGACRSASPTMRPPGSPRGPTGTTPPSATYTTPRPGRPHDRPGRLPVLHVRVRCPPGDRRPHSRVTPIRWAPRRSSTSTTACRSSRKPTLSGQHDPPGVRPLRPPPLPHRPARPDHPSTYDDAGQPHPCRTTRTAASHGVEYNELPQPAHVRDRPGRRDVAPGRTTNAATAPRSPPRAAPPATPTTRAATSPRVTDALGAHRGALRRGRAPRRDHRPARRRHPLRHATPSAAPSPITTPTGAITRLEWTVEGKLARRTDPDGADESWTYDGEGNCPAHTDAVGG